MLGSVEDRVSKMDLTLITDSKSQILLELMSTEISMSMMKEMIILASSIHMESCTP